MYDTDDLSQYSTQSGNSSAGQPDEELINKELHEVIRHLPSVYEKPILMFLTGYSYKEISQQMNIPIGTVKGRIHLGKKQMRKVYTA